MECDHVFPLHLRSDSADPYAIGGLQTLCRGCHIAKTKREVDALITKRFPRAAAWSRGVAELM